MIETLIEGPDTWEIVRDQIAAILDSEQQSQQALAVIAGEDPDLWKLRVYSERSDPWGMFQEPSPADTSPVVNVIHQTSSYEQQKSSPQGKQQGLARYYIDCVGYGASTDTAGGHTPGDLAAALEAQRAARLCRRILMSAHYTYLGLRGLVGLRFPTTVETLQPPTDVQTVNRIQLCRLALEVNIVEVAPQEIPGVLNTLAIDFKREVDGKIIAQVEYDYT